MSGMNFLGRLLDGVAVEWKPLGEVMSKITDGSHNPPKASDHGKYPMISAKNINNGQVDFDNARMLSQEDYEQENKRTRASVGDVLMTIVGSVGRVAVIKIDMAMTFQRSVCIMCPLSKIVHSDFVKYYLETKSMQNELVKQANGSAQKGLYLNQVKDLKIPIPCPDNPDRSLAIQAEIVRILDTFTALTAELTAELTARQKQYEYYRDRLLTFEKGEAEWKPLGEIGEFIRGKRFTKADYVDDGIPAIHYGEIYTHYGVAASHTLSQVRPEMAASLRYAIPGDVVMAGVGETVEDVGKAVAWIGNEKVAIHDDSWAFRHSINPKFVSYMMQTTTFINEKTKHVSSGKVKRLLINGIEKVRIPIPYPNDSKKSLTEQARIVTILDTFDTLTTDLSQGLPREIALRQQQYEYYRDLLLTFPKAERAQ